MSNVQFDKHDKPLLGMVLIFIIHDYPSVSIMFHHGFIFIHQKNILNRIEPYQTTTLW